jgi:hypothetical protein
LGGMCGGDVCVGDVWGRCVFGGMCVCGMCVGCVGGDVCLGGDVCVDVWCLPPPGLRGLEWCGMQPSSPIRGKTLPLNQAHLRFRICQRVGEGWGGE